MVKIKRPGSSGYVYGIEWDRLLCVLLDANQTLNVSSGVMDCGAGVEEGGEAVSCLHGSPRFASKKQKNKPDYFLKCTYLM